MYIAGYILSLDVWRDLRNCEWIRSLIGKLCVSLSHHLDWIGIQLTDSLAICNGCSILGRIFPLIAAQKVGPINTLILFSFTSAVMLFVWTRATDVPGILTYDAFYGISSGKSYLDI